MPLRTMYNREYKGDSIYQKKLPVRRWRYIGKDSRASTMEWVLSFGFLFKKLS